MTTTRKTLTFLAGTALTLSLATAAPAQTRLEIDEDQTAGLNQDCQQLIERLQELDNLVPDEDVDVIVDALNRDEANACAELALSLDEDQQGQDGQQADATESGEITETEQETESAEITEEVTVTETVELEGDAQVTVPEPDVDVEVPAPEVTVTQQQPSVDVTEQPSQIEVRQEQPTISVEIPELIVRVEIPAPTIYIQTQDPQVAVNMMDPEVEVTQGEPRISVRQPNPELTLDLGVDDTEGEAQAQRVESDSGDGAEQTAGDTEVESSSPEVTFETAQGEPQVNITSAEPEISYEGSEPDVSVTFTQEPTVEIATVGLPTIRFETPEQRDERRQQASAGQEDGSESRNDQGALDGQMTIGDLMELEVMTPDGESLGRPTDFVRHEGQVLMILGDAEALGLGQNAGIPLDHVAHDGDRLALVELDEDAQRIAEDYEYSEEDAVERDLPVRQ
jgi:hypothetical protein